MLISFKVKNFKNFKNDFVFNLDKVKNYEFIPEAVNNGVIKTSLIYGKNGSGKTNLGIALLDISDTLTDKQKNQSQINKPFLNLSTLKPAEFEYKFKFGDSTLIYKYIKDWDKELIKESLFINDCEVIGYDHVNHSGFSKLLGTETLNKNLNEKNISFVKYLYNNSVLPEINDNIVFISFMNFVDNMLLFSSLESNHYQGYKNGNDNISKGIIEKGKVKDLELFLSKQGIEYNLEVEELDGQKVILCNFGKSKVNLFNIASRGTCTLILFFYWTLEFEQVSFLFIDEFDAFYHNDLAKFVVKEILKNNLQAIITTHNTSIMTTDLLRPDCYFLLENEEINSFPFLTDKELRHAHNLEKMYRAGVFNE